METIYIPQLLKAPEKKEEMAIKEFISGLETLTPVKGRMVVSHGGNYLEIAAKAETIVTLSCDRCLQQYNYRLGINTSELIWLEEEKLENLPLEREVAVEELSETLPPNGYFETEKWLYEQLCLALPMRQLCGKDCQVAVPKTGKNKQEIDSRWASLEALKKQLSKNEL
ncbi:MAG: DUF177 domain-containing protein [Gomphosphaeria aponina SAG 52.96 = DSM 107014]|uniref:DUF177 domain-containing protein n=1 Tax=Gomphosphaeria aponina SAG 52.96 = DSM 107014 TaxID=1521640 RepID=A0A941GSW6_9CHRO|nr:DUF177 domain-containing protein [Gomphosphaeria aponina SAG 52.96 = DSM 107014]